MKRLFIFIAFPTALLIGIGIWQLTRQPKVVAVEKMAEVETTETLEPKKEKIIECSERTVAFENVSFKCDSSTFSQVKIELVPASFLQMESDKPDSSVQPNHVRFWLRTPNSEKPITENFNSAIYIYPIEEYKQAFSVSKDCVEAINQETTKLKRILEKRPKISHAIKNELPYIEFVDAGQMFHARTKIIDFQNGKGLVFLTQFNSEAYAHAVNNERLEYNFQGFTDDNKYFIFMTFPVSAEGLPEFDDAETDGDYKIPTTLLLNKGDDKGYDKYLLKTAVKLEKMPAAKFHPNLEEIEDLIRSLNVK
jgi:hypothetical protein